MVIYVALCIIILALTRGLAYWGVYFLKISEIPVIKDILHLTYVENTGAAFGMFRDNRIILSTVSICLFLAITYYVAANRKTIPTDILVALSFVGGGGISNVADRFTFGYVVDYIYLKFINYPVFNLADMCVVCGTIYIGFKILTAKEEKA